MTAAAVPHQGSDATPKDTAAKLFQLLASHAIDEASIKEVGHLGA
jgi:hypothetical protein